jgi:hypothetical protein
MDAKETAKYVAVHQLLATLAAVVGLGIVGVGVWLGFGDAWAIASERLPADFERVVNAVNPAPFAALTVVGVVVWQVGKTLALVSTVGRVADASGAGGGSGDVDAADVKRAVMSDVNDRISSVESDVKRHEEAISQASSRSDGASASAEERGSRRSRRRGSAATEDGRSSEGAGSSDGDGSGDAGGRASNRKSNRRASRASESRESESGGEDAN